MRKRVILASPLFLILAFATSAKATPIVYTAILTGSSEVPPSGSAATGTATITLNGNLLSVSETFTGLTTVASAAHIHCCTAPGTNTGVAIPFTGFPSATSGTYNNTFDLTLTSTYLSTFLTAEGGTAAGAETAIIAGLNSGEAYANIHDANFPGGEIRGFLTVQTPEPSGLVLLATGILGTLLVAPRRIRA